MPRDATIFLKSHAQPIRARFEDAEWERLKGEWLEYGADKKYAASTGVYAYVNLDESEGIREIMLNFGEVKAIT